MGVTILTIIHYALCVGLILIILLQAGRGGGLAAAFGGGSSETIFGTRRGNILTRTTAIGVSIFMLTSLLLTIILPKQISVIQKRGIIEEKHMQEVKTPQIPGLPQEGLPQGQEVPIPPSPEIPAVPKPETPVSPEAQRQATPQPERPTSQQPIEGGKVPSGP